MLQLKKRVHRGFPGCSVWKVAAHIALLDFPCLKKKIEFRVGSPVASPTFIAVWESPLEREELFVCFECCFLMVQRGEEGAQPVEVARGSLLRAVNTAES